MNNTKLRNNILLIYLSLHNIGNYQENKGIKLSKSYCGAELLPPLGLMYLASSLKNSIWNAIIYDERFTCEGVERIIEIVKKENPLFIGFYSDEFLSKKIVSYIKVLKAAFETPILVGGPGWLNFSLFLSNGASAVCIGDGEETVKEIAECFHNNTKLDDVKSIFINKNGTMIETLTRKPILDLDNISFPDYDAVPLHKYYDALDMAARKPFTTMVTSRGCPYKCSYCIVSTLSSSHIRVRSIENVIQEIKYLKKNHNIKYIHFYDEIFGCKKDWLEKFCNLVIENKLDFNWSCYIHPNSFNENYKQILPQMKKAGLKRINIGIQNIDEEILKSINRKPLNLEYISNLIKSLKTVGIFVSVDFIIGLPYDNISKMQNLVNYANRWEVHKININPIRIFKGTELFNKIQSGKEFLPYTEEYLNKMEKILYSKFFMSYKNFLRLLFYVLEKNPYWLVHGLKRWKFILYEIMNIDSLRRTV